MRLVAILMLVLTTLLGTLAQAGENEYLLGAGDMIRISVFQNPDLSVETRIAESGEITYPLLGAVGVGGLSIAKAERKVAKLLEEGGFVKQPQVNFLVTLMRGNQFSVLGQVNRPGRFPIEVGNMKLSDALAIAGGVNGLGSDVVILDGLRDGKPIHREIDLAALFLDNHQQDNVAIVNGDILYVHRAPQIYIHGEVNRPGAFRLERGMTIMQALATGGGGNQRANVRKMKLNRRDADGKVSEISPAMTDPLQADDVLYVPESLF